MTEKYFSRSGTECYRNILKLGLEIISGQMPNVCTGSKWYRGYNYFSIVANLENTAPARLVLRVAQNNFNG